MYLKQCLMNNFSLAVGRCEAAAGPDVHCKESLVSGFKRHLQNVRIQPLYDIEWGKRRVSGDHTKLQYSNDLSPEQKQT